MQFKIYIDPENDTDPKDTRYHRKGDDFTKLKGQPWLPDLVSGDEDRVPLPPFKRPEFKPVYDPDRTYVHLR